MKKDNSTTWKIGGGILALLIIAVAFIQTGAFKPGVSVRIEDSKSIPSGQQFTAYTSNPPTSGAYYPIATDCRVYDTELPLPQTVANMRKGHVVLFYKPSIDSTTWGKIRELGGILSKDGWFLATPNNQISSPIALASWGWYQNLSAFDETEIKAFYGAHKGQAPDNTDCLTAVKPQ